MKGKNAFSNIVGVLTMRNPTVSYFSGNTKDL